MFLLPQPAVPCEVPGDRDILLFCWHVVGGVPVRRRWPCDGSRACGDTSVPLHVAPSGGRAVSWPATVAGTSLACPGYGVVASGDSRGEFRSLESDWARPHNVVVAPEARGLMAHPQDLHQGSVTVPVSLAWHMDGQGTCRAGSRQAGDKAGPWQELLAAASGCSSSADTFPGHVHVQGFCS